MTGLYAASREALADGMCGMDGSPCFEHILQANRLIDSGVVKVIDPDDDATVERLAIALEVPSWIIRAVLRALVEDKPS